MKHIYVEKKSKNSELVRLGRLSNDGVLAELSTNLEGLTHVQAEKRLEEYGLNEVATQKPTPWYRLLLQGFNDPFIYVLGLLMVVSAFRKDYDASIIMGLMILFSAGLQFSKNTVLKSEPRVKRIN